MRTKPPKEGALNDTDRSSPATVSQDAPASVAHPASADPVTLAKDLEAQKDEYLRLAADFDSFRRRNRQESEARGAAQKESFIRDLLPVIDNLERALASGASGRSQQFHQGVEMTLQQLRVLLHQHGIESEESVGHPFDPHKHEALSQGRDPAQADQAILEVFQRGYQQGNKVFRPAKVMVNDLTSTQASPSCVLNSTIHKRVIEFSQKRQTHQPKANHDQKQFRRSDLSIPHRG
jgi:molecular chaperone GrpE